MIDDARESVPRAAHLAGVVLARGVLLQLLFLAPSLGLADVPAPFLQRAPVVDGVLDADLAGLEPLPLAPVGQAAHPGPRPPRVRFAYGAAFLYAFVEIDAERLVGRDRAYQNGDGVLLVVARAQPGGAPSDEFSVLGFSAGEPAARWQRRFVWYRDTALEMRRLDQTRLATASAARRSAFEILVPWSELYPLHPWLAGPIGLNACVTQALPGGDAVRSCLVDDARVDSESSPRRSAPAVFGTARPGKHPQSAAVLDANHVAAGEQPRLRLAVVAGETVGVAGETARLGVTVRVLSGEGSRLASLRQEVELKPGLTLHEAGVPASSLPPGGYAVEWEAGDDIGRTGLSVLRARGQDLLGRLGALAGSLSPGSATTLRFRIDELERERRRLRPTDVATSLRHALDETWEALDAAERGVDLVALGKGVLRRAYLSGVDQTLQPYSVRVPAGYRAGGRYPLLVYLHGSGEDDRGQLSRPWLPDDFLLLAPLGRGLSNWYWRDHALDDIREAIEDVTANYSVDTARIVLAGFSMGGYGVYVAARELQGRFRGLAVFSGTPRARDAVAAGAPDLLREPDLEALARVPIFAFHGGQDRNCPIEDTRALLDRLRRAGADVTFVVEPDKGHEAPGAETLAAFATWLQRIAPGR